MQLTRHFRFDYHPSAPFPIVYDCTCMLLFRLQKSPLRKFGSHQDLNKTDPDCFGID